MNIVVDGKSIWLVLHLLYFILNEVDELFALLVS
jgi:hypothetical protein